MNSRIAKRLVAPLAVLLAMAGLTGAAGVLELRPPAPVAIGRAGEGHQFTLVRPTLAGEPAVVSIGTGFNSPEPQRRYPINPDPAHWLGSALSADMHGAGFQIEHADTLASARTPLAVTVEIRDISFVYLVDPANPGWVNENYVAEGRVLARVEIYRQGALIQQRTYCGELRKEKADFSELMTGAFDDLLHKAAPDLAAALVRAG